MTGAITTLLAMLIIAAALWRLEGD